jgi:hypothetical protein
MGCREVTEAQLALLRETEGRFGVELRGAGQWAKARALVATGLGDIDGDPGQELPAMFWANEDGRTTLDDLEELEGMADECPLCGLTRSHSHGM